MAEYLILLFEDEHIYHDATPEYLGSVLQAHLRFQQQAAELGVKIINGNGLEPTTTATTIRGDVVTDGPFLETKEALGGYYLIEAADLDQALAAAKLVPTEGGVEVRPVAVYDNQ